MEAIQDIQSAGLIEQLDEISTRLIIEGCETVGPADFENVSAAAHALGLQDLAAAAIAIAADPRLAQTEAIPDRTCAASSGIATLRSYIDRLQLTSTPEASSGPGSGRPLHDSDSARTNLAADENLIREFLAEANEHLESIESQLLILEQDHSAADSINTIFRGFHTIKGLAGFFDFADLQALAHEVETLLDLARTGQLAVSPAVIDALLEANDVAHHELNCIAQRLAGKTASDTRVTPLLLNRVREIANTNPQPTPSATSVDSHNSTTDPQGALPQTMSPAQSEHEIHQPSDPSTAPERHERRGSDATSVRIDTAKLDLLMDTVGEMVIAQTLIHHSPALDAAKDEALQRNLTQLARTTAELQRIATSMRMVPIGAQFQKTARMVRDLARRFNKQIVFESSGEEAELDKSIAEQLADPLLHMVRNSIDHGIESAEERIRLGKDPTARIRIAAFHQSGQINISISDDGRGLDRNKILAKALQNGLIQPGAQPTADSDIFSLIFEPGFSTAEKVTDTSGRGVGMDVVRKHVQKLRGRIDIQSQAGIGTTFIIKLPLTLAIIDGLVVMVGDQRYVAPIFSVREILRPTKEMLSTVHGRSEMARVRDVHLPIVRLHRSFGIPTQITSLTEGMLIVTETEGKAFCLFVDRLVGNQEVVIKGLGRRFKDVSGIAGCAILGDGRVGLILDIDGIYQARS